MRAINRMQATLDPLDDAVRRIRAHIASLVQWRHWLPSDCGRDAQCNWYRYSAQASIPSWLLAEYRYAQHAAAASGEYACYLKTCSLGIWRDNPLKLLSDNGLTQKGSSNALIVG